jgi:hypothetical protein
MKTLWCKNQENLSNRISHAWAPLNINNLRIIKKSADFGKIRQGTTPPKHATCEYASNLPVFSTNPGVFLKICGFWFQSCHWGMGGGGWLGCRLVPPFFAVNSSSFRLVLLNYKQSGSFSWCKLSLLIQSHILTFKGRDQWEWIGLWKVAIDRHLVRNVVIDVLYYFNLAAILEQLYFHFRLLQLIE